MDGGTSPESSGWKVVVESGDGDLRTYKCPSEQAAETHFRKKRLWPLRRILVDPVLKILRKTLRRSHILARSADPHNEARGQVAISDVFSQAPTEGSRVNFYWTSKVEEMPASLVELLFVGRPKAGDMLSPDEVTMLEECQPGMLKDFVENEVVVNYSPQAYVISGAKGTRGRRCNGRYTAIRTHNGRPLFKSRQTGAIMYWSSYWKINFKDSTTGWLYAVPGSDGQDPPAGEWNTHGYVIDDAGRGIMVRTERVETFSTMCYP